MHPLNHAYIRMIYYSFILQLLFEARDFKLFDPTDMMDDFELIDPLDGCDLWCESVLECNANLDDLDPFD